MGVWWVGGRVGVYIHSTKVFGILTTYMRHSYIYTCYIPGTYVYIHAWYIHGTYVYILALIHYARICTVFVYVCMLYGMYLPAHTHTHVCICKNSSSFLIPNTYTYTCVYL